MTEHLLWVKSWILPHIETGRKSLEVRMPSQFMSSIRIGDILFFNKRVHRRVMEIRRHADLEELLLNEVPFKILPGHDIVLLRDRFAQIWEPGRDRNGVLVFELELVS